jgi:hypothetical protein
MNVYNKSSIKGGRMGKRAVTILVLVLYILLAPLTVSTFRPTTVYAANEECSEQRLRDLGVIVVECEPSEYFCEDTSSTLRGGDTTEKAFNYFIDKGLSKEQSAGILGNMTHESGVIPERIQNPGVVINGERITVSKDPNDAGNLGWGLIQWTPGGKILGLLKEANIPVTENGESSGRHVYDLDVQLDLVWWHLTYRTPTGLRNDEHNILERLKATTTVEEATEFFEDKVEGAGDVKLAERIFHAKNVLEDYGDNSNVESAGLTAGACISASSLNDGFVVYSQYDEQWAEESYGSSTIADSGCGPSVMAMIVTALTDENVTPPDAAIVAENQGLFIEGVGSSTEIAPILAEHYGLSAESIPTDIETISAALSAGKMVFTGGAGAKPFTEKGHFIVIRGITSDGNWLIGDSGHTDTSNEPHDPQDLIVAMKAREGSAYAISN